MKYAYFQLDDDGLRGDVYLVEAPSDDIALGKLVNAGVIPKGKAGGGALGLAGQRSEEDEDESQHVLVRVVEVR